MVTFITDPRIAYAQAARDDYRKRSLAPIQLPRNPYGASPLASALQNLTYGYLAGQEGRQANRLQEAQTAAQNQIMGQILQSSRARPPGEGGYLSQSMVSPPDPTGMRAAVGDTLPPQTQVSVNRPARPATQPIDASLAKTAGIMPAQLEMLRMKAIQQGDAATAKKIAEEAQRGLQNALLQDTPEGMQLAEQYGAILDPASSLTRQRQLADKGVARDQTVADTAARNLREETLYDVRQAGTRAYDREKTEEAREQAEKVARGKIVGVFDTTKNSNVFVTAGELIDDKQGKFAPKRTDVRTTAPSVKTFYPTETFVADGQTYEKDKPYDLTNQQIAEPELRNALSTGKFTARAPSTTPKTTVSLVTLVSNEEQVGPNGDIIAPNTPFTVPKRQLDSKSDSANDGLIRGLGSGKIQQVTPSTYEPPVKNLLRDIESGLVPRPNPESSEAFDESIFLKDMDENDIAGMLEQGSFDIPNLGRRAANFVSANLGFNDPSKATRTQSANLDQVQALMRVTLVKALSARGSNLTIELADRILPSSGKTKQENISIAKAGLGVFETNLEIIKLKLDDPNLSAKERSKFLQAGLELMRVIPVYKAMANAGGEPTGADGVTRTGREWFRVPSGSN